MTTPPTPPGLSRLGVSRVPVPVPFVEAGGPANVYVIDEADGGLALFDAGIGTAEGTAALSTSGDIVWKTRLLTVLEARRREVPAPRRLNAPPLAIRETKSGAFPSTLGITPAQRVRGRSFAQNGHWRRLANRCRWSIWTSRHGKQSTRLLPQWTSAVQASVIQLPSSGTVN